MEQNGQCEPFHRSSVFRPATIHGNVGQPRSGPRSAISPFNNSTTLVFVVITMLLCQSHSGESSSLLASSLCSQQCVCRNMTRPLSSSAGTAGPIVVNIDCSNRSLHSLLPVLSTETDSWVIENATSGIVSQQYKASSNSSGNVANQQSNETTIESKDPDDCVTTQTDINLDLSFNNVSSLEALGLHHWVCAGAVKTLNLSYNGIETVHRSFLHPFTNLVVLDLSNNLISAFTPDVLQHASSLKQLYLHHNSIDDVILQQQQQDGSMSTSTLVSLDLAKNRLLSLPPSAFSAFPLLTTLNLTDNSIVAIDQFAFTGLPHLQFLFLSRNNMSKLDYPVFQSTSLVALSLDGMFRLSQLGHNVFQGLMHLQHLNLSQNSQLSFLHHDVLSSLPSLKTLDLSGTSIHQLSSLTFRNNLKLQEVRIQDVPLSCQCTNAWLLEQLHTNNSFVHNASTLECVDTRDNRTVSLADASFPCNNVSIPKIQTILSVAIGSSLTLQCKQPFPSDNIIMWTTPRGYTYYYHHFHPNASQHLPTPADVQPHASFHKGHVWHKSSSYYSELSSYKERIQVLSDGSLFIDYILRTDAGSYSCVVRNAHFNDSGSIVVQFSYKLSGEVKILACLVGILCAVGCFTLNVIYVVISWLARRLVNKRRREHIRQMLENLNSYKSTQITRIYENYTCQLTRVRNRYHLQRDRLHKNYTMQVDRVKRGCSHQVEKVRENYTNRLTQLREYSSSQIVQIRELATNQIGRIRDYGSLQLDRLRETYKLQHLHMMKLMDTMNLDNCRSIVETECMRTESMMYDLDLLSQEDVRIESPFSMGDADSEYNTATSSPMLSVASQELVNHSFHQTQQVAGDQYDMAGGEEEKDAYFGTMAEGDMEEVLKVTRKESITTLDSQAHDVAAGGLHAVPVGDVHIEMNTVLQLPDNVQLDAKEIWTYGTGDESMHTLYTKIRSPSNAERQDPSNITSPAHPQNEGGTLQIVNDNNKIVTGTAPTSNDLETGQSFHWKESPMKQCERSPPLFHFDGYQECTTVSLYDADGEEDNEEEKTESDTMM